MATRSELFFLFNKSYHYHIYTINYLFTGTDNQVENLGETTVLACEMFTSGFCLLLKMSLAYGLKYLGVTSQNEVRFSQAYKNSQFFVQSWWMTISVLKY